MSIEVTCPSCGETRQAKDSAAGKQTNCPKCGGMISIPEPIYDAVEDTAAPGQFDQVDEPEPPTDDRERSACPLCGEMIISGAAKCRFCGEYLDLTIRGLWRQDNLLVMRKETTLPDRCVKSNEPTSRSLPRNLSWHHPTIYLTLILCGLIPYVIIALIVQKRAKIVVGLSEEWLARRRRTILIAWSMVLGGIALPIGVGIMTNGQDDAIGFSVLIGLAIVLGAAVYGIVAARIVSPTLITDTHVWLKGVHPDYLADLPNWSDGSA